MTTLAVSTDSTETEVCSAGDRCPYPFPLIAAGEPYVLTWDGKQARRWHDACYSALGGERGVITWWDGARTVTRRAAFSHPPRRPWWRRLLGRW